MYQKTDIVVNQGSITSILTLIPNTARMSTKALIVNLSTCLFIKALIRVRDVCADRARLPWVRFFSFTNSMIFSVNSSRISSSFDSIGFNPIDFANFWAAVLLAVTTF